MIFLSVCIALGILMGIIPSVVWNKKYGMNYMDYTKMTLRRKYRVISSFGLMLLMVSLLILIEELELIQESYILWLMIPSLFISNSRTIFEPYYTSGVVDELENFSLYLRPFESNIRNDKYFAKGELLIPESIEKLFCEQLRKQVAVTYCVGDPNASLPTTLSASGIYATDDEWHSVVERLSDKAKVILMRIMETEGCKWELQHCISLYLDKTIFLISGENQMKLFKEYVGNIDSNIPDVTFFKGETIAIFRNSITSNWSVVAIKSQRSIKSLLKSYLESNHILKPKVSKKDKMNGSIGGRYHFFNFILQPFWYMVYNNWPIRLKVLGFVYFIFTIILFSVLSNFNMAFALLVLAVLVLSSCWIAPKISSAYNAWGSGYLSKIGNKVLSKWILVYMSLNLVVTLLMGKFNDNYNSSQEDWAIAISESIFGNEYNDYTPLYTEIDSLYSNIYTDEKVNESVFALVQSSENEGFDEDLLNEVYYCIDNVDESEFIGWKIIHSFAYTNDYGETVENSFLIVVNENSDYYSIYSLDGESDYVSFTDMCDIIDSLIMNRAQ